MAKNRSLLFDKTQKNLPEGVLKCRFNHPVKIDLEKEETALTIRNRNAISTGSIVMVADNGATGVIKAIHETAKRQSSSVAQIAWKLKAMRDSVLPAGPRSPRIQLIQE